MASEILLVNPRRRRGRKRKAKRRAPVFAGRRRKLRAVRRRRRSNPVNIFADLTGQVMDAATGAAGALATDVVFHYLPLPSMVKSGTFAPLAKALAGVGLGVAIGQFFDRRLGKAITEGALTVQLYRIGQRAVSTVLPAVQFAGHDEANSLGYVSPGRIEPMTPEEVLGELTYGTASSIMGEIETETVSDVLGNLVEEYD